MINSIHSIKQWSPDKLDKLLLTSKNTQMNTWLTSQNNSKNQLAILSEYCLEVLSLDHHQRDNFRFDIIGRGVILEWSVDSKCIIW